MKKIRLRNLKIKPIDIDSVDERLLLINLYMTQGLTLVVSLIVFAIQLKNPLPMLSVAEWKPALLWGLGFAAAVVGADLLISRWVPEEVGDDGGVNKKLFAGRAVWHIAVLSAVVAFCEEMLFRGAIQLAWGPYWTSILFAAIHVRYLRHWLMTGLVFSISYGLGFIYDWTGTLWCPIFAHFLIDFIMGMMIRLRGDT
ncbi:MAG: abortive infection protein [Paenibacillaceae bacterium]|nr:abortive infection protein [Paenibacillaceae bacterium]